jgi:hypothetical protein
MTPLKNSVIDSECCVKENVNFLKLMDNDKKIRIIITMIAL